MRYTDCRWLYLQQLIICGHLFILCLYFIFTLNKEFSVFGHGSDIERDQFNCPALKHSYYHYANVQYGKVVPMIMNSFLRNSLKLQCAVYPILQLSTSQVTLTFA